MSCRQFAGCLRESGAMPKSPEPDRESAPETAEDMLRALLERSGQSLDGRLRKILQSQTHVGSKRVTRCDLPVLSAESRRTIHKVKITLYGAKPPIWRRLELPSDMGLDLLHEALQTVFGWFDCHYHQFETVCGEFGDEAQNDDTSALGNESTVALAQVAEAVKDKLVYVYDFGDDWRHDIVVEAITPATPGVRYPRCTGGRGAPPEEDSGGIRAHNQAVLRRGEGTPLNADDLTAALHGLSAVIVPSLPDSAPGPAHWPRPSGRGMRSQRRPRRSANRLRRTGHPDPSECGLPRPLHAATGKRGRLPRYRTAVPHTRHGRPVRARSDSRDHAGSAPESGIPPPAIP